VKCTQSSHGRRSVWFAWIGAIIVGRERDYRFNANQAIINRDLVYQQTKQLLSLVEVECGDSFANPLAEVT
jgi:hypothetical protein